MQRLAVRPTTILIDNVIAHAESLGQAIVRLAMAPIERIARACDVAGVLEQRRADHRAPRRAMPKSHRGNRRIGPLLPFAELAELT